MTREPYGPAGALSRLRAQLELLTPAQRRTASYVLASPQKVLYQTVTEVAEASSAGEATVIRLTRDLGFRGFQDFKLALAADLAAPAASEAVGASSRGLIARAAQHADTAIRETRKVLGEADLQAALDALAAAPRVLICGQGASGVTALDFAYKLLRLGLNVNATLDPHLATMYAATLPPGSVALGISRSGSTVDTVQVLRVAQERGLFTVALTHRAKSPITRHADCALYTASPEDPLDGGAIASKIGQLLVLEALFLGLTLRLPDARQAIHDTAAAVVDKSY
ncbi:MurR/RpiR family transcriptional regulator [Deinococcus peraridilitoris]|uniref:Transcriptional regulator n=1 Tax=Deinococcus peraridilitoris (strain DSM 19664 / LMG 22246 / CIP 109416 / KR-200) TaxID=937777 RepID=L0A560_DEIPD|nr:MurR/RpiR family transcriptional regulator [Deinococcus peraridilitoris]AFZ68125.1 transcriptional regulator [Deinococcus peraridilitoris DSM 19664]